MYDTEWFQGLPVCKVKHDMALITNKAIFYAVIVAVLIFGPLIYLAQAQAAEVFRDKDDRGGPAVLKLSDKPCTNAKVRAHLFDKLLDDRRFKAATLFYWGREWAACWVDRNGIVHSMDEQGAPLQPVPRTAFKDDAV